MMRRWQWTVGSVTRRLWFKASLYGVGAVLTAFVAAVVGPFVPHGPAKALGVDSVSDILTILATSMLTVATFSLGTMVAGFSAAANSATPRAAKLLIEDPIAQNVISTFIGVFVFSLVGIMALATQIYDAGGRAVLFLVTLMVLALVLVTFFRWIDYLSRLGRMAETIDRVEAATTLAVRAQCRNPHLGGRPLGAIPPTARPLLAQSPGYVQFLDVRALEDVASKAGGAVHVTRLPGAFADATEPLAWTSWEPDEDERRTLLQAFAVGTARSFDQDARFGIIVLAEIGSRALSSGVNDPGTAIDILGRFVRVLSVWAEASRCGTEEPCFERVFVPAISTEDLFDDAFSPIARDGAGMIEIGIRLQKALRSLAAQPGVGFSEPARRHSALALKRALAACTLEEDRRALEDQAAKVA